MDQPGKVANPARGQLNRENEYSSVPAWRLMYLYNITKGFSPDVILLTRYICGYIGEPV